MSGSRAMTIVEVGPRDGFQPIETFIPTQRKLDIVSRLHASGIRRMEATAFVSNTAVPQLSDAAVVLDYAQSLPDLNVQVLVPNRRHAERALKAGARHLAFVMSVSEKHNINNVRKLPLESLEEFAAICAMLPQGVAMRFNLATAFDCPFEGTIPAGRTLNLIARAAAIHDGAEICPCDTTGRVTPDRVEALLTSALESHPAVAKWAYHGHDTYGLGIANLLAARAAGVTVVDASVAGLGGCPFAPGATGNVATEDVVWTLAGMGVDTGVDLDLLMDVANDAATLPGGLPGGRAREALRATLCRAVTA